LCNADVVVDSRTISAANTVQDGIDAGVTYVARTKIGMFNLNANINKIFNNKVRQNIGDPLVTRLDTIGNPISLRGRGGIGYSTGPFSANLFANYVGSYTNDQPITLVGAAAPEPISRVPSYTTFDLSLALSFPRMQPRWEWLSGVRLGVTITNVFDKDPPIVQSVLTGGQSIDPFAHGVMGRYMQFSLTKTF
jgi:iron complex outermembrane receptor protein